jgi:hypothetical protein
LDFKSNRTIKYGKTEFSRSGTQTAGLAFGGYDTALTAAQKNMMDQLGHNNPPGLNTARNFSRCGTQTAALAFGGGPPNTAATEEYDGSTWTSVQSLNTARNQFSRCRNTNSSFSFWWSTPPGTTGATEEYDGSTWTK